MATSAIEAEILEQGRRIDPVLEELLPAGGPGLLGEMVWYHLRGGGKRIRPALCLMTCEALGGDSERALHFAAGVELLHGMFLLHDDVMDGDEFRHDQPTVWKKYGVANAINTGDFMLAGALRAVMRSPVDSSVRARLVQTFLATYERTIEGQELDINARSNPAFSVSDYLRMAELKTGHYLVIGMVGGAVITGAQDSTVQCLHRLGRSMGPAFQIRDDMIDLTAGKGRGGVKGSDIREGKASILYAHALAHASPDDRERLLDIMRKPRSGKSDEDVNWVSALYERCGSPGFAGEKADELIRRALAELEALPAAEREALDGVVRYMVERSY